MNPATKNLSWTILKNDKNINYINAYIKNNKIIISNGYKEK